MADLLDPTAEASLAPPRTRWTHAVWAVAASLLVHSISVVALYSVHGSNLDTLRPTQDGSLFEASVLPANAPATANPAAMQATELKPLNTKTEPAQAAEPPPKSPTSAPAISDPLAAAPTPDNTSATNPVNEPETVITPVAAVPPTPPATDLATTPVTHASNSEPVISPLSPYQYSSQTPYPYNSLAREVRPYALPNQLNVRYETNYQGIAALSELQWKKTDDEGVLRYEASLVTSALGMELRYKSIGSIGINGLAPLAIEEKRPFKSAIAISIEPSNNRVIISSKEGFLPYDPLGHDLISLIIQLGMYTQLLPHWSQSGTMRDFTVYRPNGIKRWRLQSQGLDTIQVRGEMRQVVYIRRIASDGQPDYEDQYHFWLDPKLHGFPVKMRQVDNTGRVTDIVMTDWKER